MATREGYWVPEMHAQPGGEIEKSKKNRKLRGQMTISRHSWNENQSNKTIHKQHCRESSSSSVSNLQRPSVSAP
jgi:hypothetical protein